MAPKLKIEIRETVTLQNDNKYDAYNRFTLDGINHIDKRIVRVPIAGTEIMALSGSIGSGTFKEENVRYMRFTNLCSTNFISLYLIQDSPEAQNPNTGNVGSGDESLFKLDAGKSMVFSNAQFQGTDYYDYVVDGYVDLQYISSFASLYSIKAKANNKDIRIEYLVGSS